LRGEGLKGSLRRKGKKERDGRLGNSTVLWHPKPALTRR
jgi:hypothetical protein